MLDDIISTFAVQILAQPLFLIILLLYSWIDFGFPIYYLEIILNFEYKEKPIQKLLKKELTTNQGYLYLIFKKAFVKLLKDIFKKNILTIIKESLLLINKHIVDTFNIDARINLKSTIRILVGIKAVLLLLAIFSATPKFHEYIEIIHIVQCLTFITNIIFNNYFIDLIKRFHNKS